MVCQCYNIALLVVFPVVLYFKVNYNFYQHFRKFCNQSGFGNLCQTVLVLVFQTVVPNLSTLI